MSRDLILVGFALLTWGIGEGMFFLFQPIYLEKLGANPLLIGTILGGMGVAMCIAHIPAGYLADRAGRRPLMWAAWITGTVATWIMALANSLPYFVTGLVFYGLTSFVMAPMNSYITAARGKLSVGRAITMISALYNTGWILGPFLGGLIGDRAGLQRIYLFSACAFGLSTLIILFIRSQPVEDSNTEDKSNGLHFNRQVLVYFGIIFLAMFATYLAQPLTPNFLQNERGLGLSEIGRLGSIAGLGIVILNMVLGNLNSRRGFLLGQMSAGIFPLLLWRGSGFPWYAAGYFFMGGNRVARSLAIAQIRDLIHQAKMGLAYGITETVSSSAFILAPPLAGFLYERDPILIYPISLVLIIFSLLISGRFAPRQEGSTVQQAPTPNKV